MRGAVPSAASTRSARCVALEQALRGFDLTDLDLYVGVSSGAFVAAGLANGITPGEMHAMFILDRSHHDPFEPELLLRPAFGEFMRRLVMLPALMQSALFAYAGASPFRGFVESFARLTRGLPNGLFDNGAIASYLARLFGKPGRTDDFRKLKHKLFIVAADLDTGKATRVRRAGLRPRADLRGGEGEFGAARTLSARAHRRPRLRRRRAEEDAARLRRAEGRGEAPPLRQSAGALRRRPRGSNKSGRRPRPLAERGLVTVLSQTFRSLIHSRMRVGMERYKTEFPDADVVLFEPARDDEVIFFANIFSYGDRQQARRARLSPHAERARARASTNSTPSSPATASRIDRAALKGRLPRPGKARQETAGQTGRLWDSVRPLETALGDLEKALNRDKPG